MPSVEIYTKSWCGFCQAAKRLLTQKGVAFTEYDVEKDRARLPEMIDRAHGRRTVPQIFIGTTHVGGCDDLFALNGEGKLDALLAS
jgi:glutaredoxin 3